MVKISMDGKGAWRDKGMIERFWPSLKYEYVYLNAFEKGSTAWVNGPKREAIQLHRGSLSAAGEIVRYGFRGVFFAICTGQ